MSKFTGEKYLAHRKVIMVGNCLAHKTNNTSEKLCILHIEK